MTLGAVELKSLHSADAPLKRAQVSASLRRIRATQRQAQSGLAAPNKLSTQPPTQRRSSAAASPISSEKFPPPTDNSPSPRAGPPPTSVHLTLIGSASARVN